MILWTIQHEKAYEKMQSSGFLSANEEFLFCEDDFREAYDWMAEQMTQRIYAAPEGIKHPVWAW